MTSRVPGTARQDTGESGAGPAAHLDRRDDRRSRDRASVVGPVVLRWVGVHRLEVLVGMRFARARASGGSVRFLAERLRIGVGREAWILALVVRVGPFAWI